MNIKEIPLKTVEIFLKLNGIKSSTPYQAAIELINTNDFESIDEIDHWLTAYEYYQVPRIRDYSVTALQEMFETENIKEVLKYIPNSPFPLSELPQEILMEIMLHLIHYSHLGCINSLLYHNVDSIKNSLHYRNLRITKRLITHGYDDSSFDPHMLEELEITFNDKCKNLNRCIWPCSLSPTGDIHIKKHDIWQVLPWDGTIQDFFPLNEDCDRAIILSNGHVYITPVLLSNIYQLKSRTRDYVIPKYTELQGLQNIIKIWYEPFNIYMLNTKGDLYQYDLLMYRLDLVQQNVKTFTNALIITKF